MVNTPMSASTQNTNQNVGAQQTTSNLGFSDYLNFLATLAQLAAALRKQPKEKRPLYYGQIGTTGGPMRYQGMDITSFILR